MSFLEIKKWDTRFAITQAVEAVGSKFNVYEKSPTAEQKDGSLEFEIVLNKKPATNKFTFPIETANLELIYQPPLTAWELANGFFRPENVVGSYAAYHKSKRAMYSNVKDAELYRVGKAFHIYRPQLIDYGGAKAWADLAITQSNLSITLPQTFLNKAVYPITVDPNFGYTAIGASNWTNTNTISANLVSCPEAGTATSISAYYVSSASGNNLKFSLYTSAKALMSGTAEWASTFPYTDWKLLNLTSSQEVSATNYVLCLWQNNAAVNGSFKYDSSGSAQWASQSLTYNGWPNPGAWGSYANYIFSIYCTYTAGGGGVSVPVMMHHYSQMNKIHRG